jgi:tRNA (guanine37-N1)-methyltransferase
MTLKRLLEGTVPDSLLHEIPTSYDVIGDIAIVSVPPSCRPFRQDIALAVMAQRRNVKTVLSRLPGREREGRVPRFEVLIGASTATEHRESGFRYRLDVSRVFFSPRLAAERKRVAPAVRPGEDVVVPFCGVGPFVIPAASKGAAVTAIENNPEAVRWLRENLALNRVEDRVRVVEGDAREVLAGLPPVSDRVICPAPYGADDVLPLAASCLKDGGVLHFYTFKNDRQAEEMARHFPLEGLEVVSARSCGPVAPGVNRYVFDLRRTG